jgi:hypothetical protein
MFSNHASHRRASIMLLYHDRDTSSIAPPPARTEGRVNRTERHTAALEHADALRRQHHAAQVAGNPAERERLARDVQRARDIVCIQNELDAADWMRGLRLACELYESQLGFHINELIEEAVERRVAAILQPAIRRLGLVEDAVLDLESGVRA